MKQGESPSFRLWGTGDARCLDSDSRQPDHLGKKRTAVTELCEKRLTRLKTIVSFSEEKHDVLAQIRAMREWLVEHEWWHQQPDGEARLHMRLPQVDPALWRRVRQETRTRHQEQLNRYRFRHYPLVYLASLEARWEQSSCT